MFPNFGAQHFGDIADLGLSDLAIVRHGACRHCVDAVN
jgi:hypothetical protein